MHKRKSQNQTDRFTLIFNFIFFVNNLKIIYRKELDEELEYLEGGQASQSKWASKSLTSMQSLCCPGIFVFVSSAEKMHGFYTFCPTKPNH